MARTALPRALVIQEIADESVTRLLFRIVKSDNRDDPLFDQSFRSHYELGLPPRRAEGRSTVVHMGLSMYDSIHQAIATARLWRQIGEWVATVRLGPGHGFNLARIGPAHHWTVWGRPEALKAAVVGTVHIDQR
jgi:hypothetical protein